MASVVLAAILGMFPAHGGGNSHVLNAPQPDSGQGNSHVLSH